MLYATNIFPGDNTTRQFELTFVGGYLDKSHIVAYYEDNLSKVQTPIDPGTITWLGPYTVQLPPGAQASVGTNVVFARQTPREPLVDFQGSSRITEANLDLAHRQGLFVAVESLDSSNSEVVAQLKDVIIGVQEVADEALLSAGAAAASASAAAGSAGVASSQASQAMSSATAAQGQATAASGFATTALTYRNDAEGFKNTAGASATAAATSEANALAYRNTASGHASAALGSANAASSSAAAALASQNAAAGSASAANTSANAAAVSASNANTSAGFAANEVGLATAQKVLAVNAANAAAGSASSAATSAANATSAVNTAVSNANARWPGYIRNNWHLRASSSTDIALQPVLTNWTQTVVGNPPVDISSTVMSVSSGFPTLYASNSLHWVYSYGVNAARELSIYGVLDNVGTTRPVYAPLSDVWFHPQTGEVCFGGFFPISNALVDSPTARGLVSLANRQSSEVYSRLTAPVGVTGTYDFTEMSFIGMEGDLIEFSMQGLLSVEAGGAGSTLIATWRLNNVQQSGADFRVLDTVGAKTLSLQGRARLTYSGLHSVRAVVTKASGGGSFTLNGAASLGAEVYQSCRLFPTRRSAI